MSDLRQAFWLGALFAFIVWAGINQLFLEPRKRRMTTLATLLGQLSTQLTAYQADQANVAADAEAVKAAQAKEATDTTTQGTDLATLQATWTQCKAEAAALGLT